MTDWGRVSVGWLTAGKPDSHFMWCFDKLRHYDWNRPAGAPLLANVLPCEANSGGIVDSRNAVVRAFLDGTDDDWLLWLDDDMGFAPDTLDRLRLAADPLERPIVGALAFFQFIPEDQHGPDLLGTPAAGFSYAPTIFQFSPPPILRPVYDYPRDALVECAATGSACILIHRSVFAKMRLEFEGPHHWYARPIVELADGERREFGEDTTFCIRARNCGFPTVVDTSVKTSHKKTIYLTEETVAWLSAMPRSAAEPVAPPPASRSGLGPVPPAEPVDVPLAVPLEEVPQPNRRERRRRARA